MGWELEEERNWGTRVDLEVEGMIDPPKKRRRSRDCEQR